MTIGKIIDSGMDRKTKHLRKIMKRINKQSCLHDGCSTCCGTFIRLDGTACVHMLSCPCSKCSPWRW